MITAVLLVQAIEVVMGKKFDVDRSLDQRRMSGNSMVISPAVPIAFLGTNVKTMAPVLLTVVGLKVTVQDVN